MNARISLVLASSFALTTLAALAGCSGAAEPDPNGEKKSTSTSGTEPAGEDAGGGSSKGGSSLGPSCTAYLDCCEEVAAKVPQLAASCDSTRTAIEDAQAKGAATSSYESACKSGTDGFVSAGYCK